MEADSNQRGKHSQTNGSLKSEHHGHNYTIQQEHRTNETSLFGRATGPSLEAGAIPSTSTARELTVLTARVAYLVKIGAHHNELRSVTTAETADVGNAWTPE